MELSRISAEKWSILAKLLSQQEQERAEQFRFCDDKNSYIAAHALKRVLLSQITGTSPTALRFQPGRNGKPALDRATTAIQPNFNLSHTRGVVAIAVALHHQVGVDVEPIAAKRLDADSEQDMFAPSERTRLHALSGLERVQTALALWTLKEASLKALGLGIDYPLTELEVSLETMQIHGLSDRDYHPAYWQMHSQQICADHLLAVAIRRRSIDPVHVDVREISIGDPSQSP